MARCCAHARTHSAHNVAVNELKSWIICPVLRPHLHSMFRGISFLFFFFFVSHLLHKDAFKRNKLKLYTDLNPEIGVIQ